MYKPSTDRPTQAQLVFPILDAIDRAGGSARAKDVILAPSGYSERTSNWPGRRIVIAIANA